MDISAPYSIKSVLKNAKIWYLNDQNPPIIDTDIVIYRCFQNRNFSLLTFTVQLVESKTTHFVYPEKRLENTGTNRLDGRNICNSGIPALRRQNNSQTATRRHNSPTEFRGKHLQTKIYFFGSLL